MALTTCPDCKSQVSDRAPSCPKCGRPISAITVEQTGKRWKAAELLFAMLTIGGCVTTIASTSGGDHSTTSMVIGAASFWIGLIGFVVARVGAWWQHG